jgi:transcriptional regulator with XRE-family HTH domain
MKEKRLYRKVAKEIIIVRKRKQISQEQLALLSDVDRTYMARIEEGKANPSVKILHKLSVTLNIPLNKLLGKL